MTALIGLFSGFALIVLALSLGGSAAAFINGAGILIVILGTVAVTLISFSWEELRGLPRALWNTMFSTHADPAAAAHRILRLAERARREGILVLEKELRASRSDPFLHNALNLLTDGTGGPEIERILSQEAGSIASRHSRVSDLLRRAGEVAPAMGLIGTLIGLVNMLGRLNDPAAIGPAMAVALLTTFYGAILAHMVCLPLAAKAERNSEAESLVNAVYTLGAGAIGRQEHPRRLEALINAVLPPEKRVQYFK